MPPARMPMKAGDANGNGSLPGDKDVAVQAPAR
jgi:hypothetical protein